MRHAAGPAEWKPSGAVECYLHYPLGYWGTRQALCDTGNHRSLRFSKTLASMVRAVTAAPAFDLPTTSAMPVARATFPLTWTGPPVLGAKNQLIFANSGSNRSRMNCRLPEQVWLGIRPAISV